MAGFALTPESLAAWCERQSFAFRITADPPQIAVEYRVLGEECPLLILHHGPRADMPVVTLAMVLPLVVPEERAPALREALSLLNHATYLGAWVHDHETGQVYFRLGLPALDNEYSDAGLHFAARAVVSTVEAIAPKLQAVLQQGAAPATVLPAA